MPESLIRINHIRQAHRTDNVWLLWLLWLLLLPDLAETIVSASHS